MKMRSKFIAGICICAVCAGSVLPVLADAQSDLAVAHQQQEETAASIVSIQERIDTLESKKGEKEAYLEELNKQVGELTEELDGLHERFSAKQLELDSATQALADAELDEEEQREAMKLRMQYIYENSLDDTLLESFLSSASFSEFLTRASNVKDLTTYDRQMFEDYQEVCEEVQDRKEQVEAEQKEIKELSDQCEGKRQEMQALCESASDEVESLSKELEGEEGKAAELMALYQEQEAMIGALSVQAAAEVAAAQASYGSYYSYGGDSYSGDSPASTYVNTSTWDGSVLTKRGGVNQGPTGKETYYNLNMSYVVRTMRDMGNEDPYWVRDDGVKMLGDYVMVAANFDSHPRGSLVESSLGTAIVVDTGSFAARNPEQLDIAVSW